MPRPRKPKRDDVHLTYTQTRTFRRAECIRYFDWERQDTIENIDSELEMNQPTPKRRAILETLKQRITEYTFPQFLHDYLNDDRFTEWVNVDNGDPRQIDDFISEMFTSLYDDLEKETRKRNAALWCTKCCEYLRGRHKCAS